jgi:hypothetical protein
MLDEKVENRLQIIECLRRDTENLWKNHVEILELKKYNN